MLNHIINIEGIIKNRLKKTITDAWVTGHASLYIYAHMKPHT